MSGSPDVIEIGRWKIASDVESTRKTYAATLMGGPEECGCTPCLNFAAQRNETYPPDVMRLFEQLGIAANREAEIYHMARLESGKHLYGGWFHFVGSIISGADAARKIGENIWQPDLEAKSEFFCLGFSARADLVRKPFEGLPLVQLEFTVKIPWIIAAEEPK
jgi:hypothetical protein